MKSFSKKLLIFAAVMAVVAGAGWFGRKAYKKTMERRLVSQSREYLARKDFHNASLSLQRALEMNPVSVSATEAMADLLDNADSPAALNWRMRAAKLDPKNSSKRFQWAEMAIKANDLASAAEALDGADAEAKNTAVYHKLKGALAWSEHNAAAASEEYLAAARLEPQNLAIQINLATIGLASTNPAVEQAARASLQQIATNADMRLNALHKLLADAIVRKSVRDAVSYSAQIVKDPGSIFKDKIEYLELLRQDRTQDYGPWLASLEKDAGTSSDHAFELARWKVVTSGPTNAFHWLAGLPPQVRTNMPVPLVMTDCQLAMKDWAGILKEVESEDWGEAGFYQLALQSLAERSLSQNTAADASWHKAFRAAAHNLDKLSHLAEVTKAWGWQPECSELLTEIVGEFPQENWAIDELGAQLYAQGKTSQMESLYFRAYSKDPSNPSIKNNLANLYLLRKIELGKAHTMAKEAYDSSTNNPFFISTYAYSLLLQDKKNEALNVVSGLKAEYLKIPSVALYYGVVQAESGRKEAAREALKRAEAGKLLPEEKAIAQLAESRM